MSVAIDAWWWPLHRHRMVLGLGMLVLVLEVVVGCSGIVDTGARDGNQQQQPTLGMGTVVGSGCRPRWGYCR